jgi:hypothetical protein
MIRHYFFAIVSLAGYIRDGLRQRANVDAALTTNHLPMKGESWLSLSVPNPLSASTSFPRQKARSLPMWNCLSHPITTSLRSCFRTKPHSPSILIRVSRLLQSLSAGNLEVTNPFAAGDQFSASNDFSNTNTTPAFSGRVFLSGLARGSPEEYGGGHPATCGGAQ